MGRYSRALRTDSMVPMPSPAAVAPKRRPVPQKVSPWRAVLYPRGLIVPGCGEPGSGALG
jgi:hypothetical protein